MIDHQALIDAHCRQLECEGLEATHLRSFWIPAQPLPEAEFIRLFQQIDEGIH